MTRAATTYRDDDVEASSGKGSGDENFPVASLLIAPRLRPHVLAYYAFARAADDVADDEVLSAEEKVRRLDAMEAVATGRADGLSKPEALRASLAETGVPIARATDLLAAFRQDARKSRYADWAQLMAYCQLSAAPVGRFLLDLHGEAASGYPASDALCAALQVLNHLQDQKQDYRRLSRVYLPTDWLEQASEGVGALDAPISSGGLTRVRFRMLDETDRLLDRAEGLTALRSSRLRAESAVILRLARTLSAELRRRDPLAERVTVGPLGTGRAALAGLGAVIRVPRPAQARSA